VLTLVLALFIMLVQVHTQGARFGGCVVTLRALIESRLILRVLTLARHWNMDSTVSTVTK